MSDYNRQRRNFEQPDENENYYQGNKYDQSNYGTHSRDSQGRPYGEEVNSGYSSYGAQEENPYRGTNREGGYSRASYDRDGEYRGNEDGSQRYYGSYNSLAYDDIDRRHNWQPSDRRQDWRNNPNNLGVGSNYAFNRGGYGSNFGGEYGHFPQRGGGTGYAGEYGNTSYARQRRDGDYNRPHREYSSYSGRYDRDYERSWERDNRDWWDRTRDEVASWFGDDDAERRRYLDKQRGDHRGRGPKGYRRSDTRIEEDINDRLADDGWVDASDIEIKVENGEVMLTGTAPDRFCKRRAEDIAESVSGVNHVENRIRVTRQDLPQTHMNQAASYRGERGNSTNNIPGKTDGKMPS